MNSIVRNNTDSVEYFIIFNGSNLITGIIILIYFLLFPFYVYVNKANRKRDQAVLIYPFTKHFFKMTVVMSILYVIFIAGMLSGVLFLVRKSPYIAVSGLAIFFAIQALSLVTHVFNLLLSLLGIAKFILYFFPSQEKRVSSIQKSVYRRIWLLYVACSFEDAILYVWVLRENEMNIIKIGLLVFTNDMYIDICFAIHSNIDKCSEACKSRISTRKQSTKQLHLLCL
ncbi:Serpentine Receptor, class Z [Caenorhabditis elegans]|uniref:Serpentine Receptor, class Z n=1 Tax=Caenorhabditis elegans TaxID=6239 RepID=O44454_CAEEL|nr:Serpentine Receptor, class Z [Caenorhabditis elegans]CCD62194.2 Serpentine Receptor, class Z [Caenorhabditis elegans]|eukprot:NP_001343611.1 Serpentine Receptor, class Z [Caenorhabditis elegans]